MLSYLQARKNQLFILGGLIYYGFVVWLLSNIHPLGMAAFRAFGIIGVQVLIFFIHRNYLLPRFAEQKKWLGYIAFSLLALFLCTLSLFVGEQLEETFFPGVLRFPGPFRHGPGPITRFVGGLLVTGFFPMIISALQRNTELLRQREAESLQLKNQMLEAETRALRSQINPHFLFNTLNNIYSLTQMRSEKTGDVVMQLSEMLRYVIYESNEKYVPLREEIAYIESYVQLQLLKDDEISNVTVQLPEDIPDLKIAPMLLIPFIENSFKHSKFEDIESGWVEISLKIKGKSLHLLNRNSLPPGPHSKDKVGGIGMENVRRRLELIYPEQHILNIHSGENTFSVDLHLELNEAL